MGGSSPGIAAGPESPIVNSVARMLSVSPRSFVLPSGSVALAFVPGSSSSVALRLPSASVISEPWATWISFRVRSTPVTLSSYGTITTGSTMS